MVKETGLVQDGSNLFWRPYEGYDYRGFWKDRKYEELVERSALRRLLPNEGNKNERLIDLGSNYGRLSDEFKNYNLVVLSDGARSAVHQAKQMWNSQPYVLVVSDLRFSPFQSNTFDIVVCIRTLHHLTRPEELFSEARRLLKPGGYLVLEYANKRNLKQLLLHYLDLPNRDILDLQPTSIGENILNFHPHQINDLLKAHGFHCEQVIGVSLFRWEPLKKVFSPHLLCWLDTKLQQFSGRHYLTPSIFTYSRVIK